MTYAELNAMRLAHGDRCCDPPPPVRQQRYGKSDKKYGAKYEAALRKKAWSSIGNRKPLPR